MSKEPASLGDRLKEIERRLDEVEIDRLVEWSIWEKVTLPLLGMLAATPANRPRLLQLVESGENLAQEICGDEGIGRFRRLFALLRSHLADPNGPDPCL